MYLQAPKRFETSGKKRKTIERKYVRGMAFAQKYGVAVTHHHGDFFGVWQLIQVLFTCCVCDRIDLLYTST